MRHWRRLPDAAKPFDQQSPHTQSAPSAPTEAQPPISSTRERPRFVCRGGLGGAPTSWQTRTLVLLGGWTRLVLTFPCRVGLVSLKSTETGTHSRRAWQNHPVGVGSRGRVSVHGHTRDGGLRSAVPGRRVLIILSFSSETPRSAREPRPTWWVTPQKIAREGTSDRGLHRLPGLLEARSRAPVLGRLRRDLIKSRPTKRLTNTEREHQDSKKQRDDGKAVE